MDGVPESMCYTSDERKEPVLGWFGEHEKLQTDTRVMKAEGEAEKIDERSEVSRTVSLGEPPELAAARQRKQRIAAALNRPNTDDLRRSFEKFDKNSDGKLDLGEVKRLLRAGNPKMGAADIETIFHKVDTTLDRKKNLGE